MSETLSSAIGVSLTGTLANVTAQGTSSFGLALSSFLNSTLATGTGGDKANQLYVASAILPAAGNYVSVAAIHSGGGGSGYAVGDFVKPADGTGSSAVFRVATISGSAIATLSVIHAGRYSVNPTTTSNAVVTLTGSGSSGSLDLTMATITSTSTIDLYAGLGNDQLGVALALATIKTLAIQIQGNLGCSVLTGVAIAGGGTGYSNGTLTIMGGTGTPATIAVTQSGGVITGVSVSTAGSYTTAPGATGAYAADISGANTGKGATFNLTFTTATAGVSGGQVFASGDILNLGGDNTSNTWVSLLADKTDIIQLRSGTLGNPGTILLHEGGSVGWVVGSTNKYLLVSNKGSNPIAYQVVINGATA